MPQTQNPPLSNIKKANVYKSLAEHPLIPQIHGVLFFLGSGFAIAAVLFIFLNSFPLTLLFAGLSFLLLVIPGFSIYLHFHGHPDILSLIFWNKYEQWQNPFKLPPFETKFQPRLKTHDVINVLVSFHIPGYLQTDHNKKRITIAVEGALAKYFSDLSAIPTYDEIQTIIDPPFDVIARELNIPVWYATILDRYNDRNQPTDAAWM